MNRFEPHLPSELLKPYIKCFVLSESDEEQSYKVLPNTSFVIGIQYRGRLAQISGGAETPLAAAGITGLQDSFRIFKNDAHTGTLLIYFTDTGAAGFISQPLHELFGQSLALDHFFSPSLLNQLREQLTAATTDLERLQTAELFLIAQLREVSTDPLVNAAITAIRQSQGAIRIKDLAARLNTSHSPLEKRFRRIVGTSPKKFAAIVRLQNLIQLAPATSLTETGYQAGYYDQAHFIRDFKNFTGETPEKFFSKK